MKGASKMREKYIGDGVYVGFTGWDFKLWTERENGRHYIHLEPEAVEELSQFVKECTGETK